MRPVQMRDFDATSTADQVLGWAYADVTSTAGSEQEQATQMQDMTTYQVVTRFRRDEIKTTDYIEGDGRKLNILSIKPDLHDDGKYTGFTCRTRDTETTGQTMR